LVFEEGPLRPASDGLLFRQESLILRLTAAHH